MSTFEKPQDNEVGWIHDDGTLPGDPGYVQGNNEAELKNDCGLAIAASNLNDLTGSKLSENDSALTALNEGITSKEDDGRTYSHTNELGTGRDVLYSIMSEQTPEAGNISVDSVNLAQENMDDINAALQATEARIDASVDAKVLWGETESFEKVDHSIAIQEPTFDDDGDIVGYLINDTSGSGKTFAEVDELEDAGLFRDEQLVISKNHETVDPDEIADNAIEDSIEQPAQDPADEPIEWSEDEVIELHADEAVDDLSDPPDALQETEDVNDGGDFADESFEAIEATPDESFEGLSDDIVLESGHDGHDDLAVNSSVYSDLSDDVSIELMDTLDCSDMLDTMDTDTNDDVSIDSGDVGSFDGGMDSLV